MRLKLYFSPALSMLLNSLSLEENDKIINFSNQHHEEQDVAI